MSHKLPFYDLTIAVLAGSNADPMIKAFKDLGGCPTFFSFETENANPDWFAQFANRMLTAEIDIAVFATGVGVNFVSNQAARRVERQRFLDSLIDITTIATSPLANHALCKLGITPSLTIANVRSWRDIMIAIDQNTNVTNQTVALEETGTFTELAASLEARGARIVRIPIFPTTTSIDSKPQSAFVERMKEGEFQVVVIDSASHAAQFCFKVRQSKRDKPDQHAASFERTLETTLLVAFGTETEEILESAGINVDYCCHDPSLDLAIAELANQIGELRERQSKIRFNLSGPASSNSDRNAPWYNGPFMKACRREVIDVPPIWILGQTNFLPDATSNHQDKMLIFPPDATPDRLSEWTCLSTTRLGIDAAIVPLDPMALLSTLGFPQSNNGQKPKLSGQNSTSNFEIDRLTELVSIEQIPDAAATVQRTRNDLPADIPLVGLSLGPWTLARRLIDGVDTNSQSQTKALMWKNPNTWYLLLELLSSSIACYLAGQIEAGAQCVRLSDPDTNGVSFTDYKTEIAPFTNRIIASLPTDVPVIYSAYGNPALLPLLADTHATAIGVDHQTQLDHAWQTIGPERVIDGNLDPLVLMTEPETVRSHVRSILDQAGGRAGHLFGLGSELVPLTPFENLIALVDAVRES